MRIVNRPPTSIQIEPVLGCNLRCDFCPNCQLPKKAPSKWMRASVAEIIALEIQRLAGKSNLRLDMALRGEPMLHPNLPLIISIFRDRLPRAQISIVTNGYNLSPVSAQELFESGLNFIYLDCYGASYSKWKTEFMSHVDAGDYAVRDAKDVTHWQWHGSKKRCVILGPDIRYEKKSTRNMVSFCQALPKKNCEKYNIPWITKPLEKRCADPFRSINITWEGNVLLCCRDWNEKRVMCKLMQDNSDLTDYWYNDRALNMIRTLLYNKIRDFPPCEKCDYNGGGYFGNFPDPGQDFSAEDNAQYMDDKNI